jgi:hypothetical protein
MRAKPTFIIVSLATTLGIVALFTYGCIPPIIPGLPTPTPSLTPRVCPPDTILESGDHLESTPTLFVIVFDPNATTGGIGLEYKDGSKTFNTLEFINRVIPSFSGPGDQYSLFEFGYREYSDARIGGFESRLPSSPLHLETPIPYLTATPYNTPNPTALATLEDLERLRVINDYNSKVQLQQSEIEREKFEQYCRDKNFNDAINATATIWEATKLAEVTQIATKIKGDEESKKQNTGRPTPFLYQEVYVGLRHAATDFEYLCKNYKKCILIIFDELLDWRNPSKQTRIPDDIGFRLDNVNIIAVLPDCSPIQDPMCQDRISRWDDKFKSLGAISTQYFDGIRLEEKLANYIAELKYKSK